MHLLCGIRPIVYGDACARSVILFYKWIVLTFGAYVPCRGIKYLHAVLHSLAGCFIILGLAFVEKFKVTSTERHFFSLHSWVGISAIAMYVAQYVAGVRLKVNALQIKLLICIFV